MDNDVVETPENEAFIKFLDMIEAELSRRRVKAASEVKRCYRMVWAFRKKFGDLWPTPPVGDCLRFAAIEAHEAMDAELRENKLYKRNNRRNVDKLDELADCALMLITANRGPGKVMHCYELDSEPTVDDISYHVSDILRGYNISGAIPLGHLTTTLHFIARHEGMYLPKQIASRLRGIYRKHIKGKTV